MPDAVLYAAIGLATGFLAGMLGAGGGFATVVLLLAAGNGAHDAVGTSLLYAVVVAGWGASVHLRRGTADWRLSLALGVPAAVTAIAGAQIAEGLSDRALVIGFAALTTAVAIAFMLRRDRAGRTHEVADEITPAPLPADGATGRPSATGRRLGAALSGGAVIGVLQGLMGVGGGFLLVPFMVLLLGVGERVAVGTSLLAITVGGLAGGVRHLLLGNVRASILFLLLPGGLIGSYVGATLVRRLEPARIRQAFVALMTASAAYLLTRAL